MHPRRAFFGAALGFLLVFPSVTFAAIQYTRSPTGNSPLSPLSVRVVVDSFSDYGFTPGVDLYYITLDDDYNPHTDCFPSSQLDASATFDLPPGDVVKGVMVIGFTGFCESGDEPYYLEGDGSGTAFTIISPALGVSSGGGTPAYRPEVNVLAPRGENYFSSAVPVSYEATDKNDASVADGEHPFGLSSRPVAIYYSDQILEWNHTIVENAEKTLITRDLPAKGSYTWQIGDLTPGNFYRIIVDAVDKVGEIGEDVSDLFTIDLTKPTFIVRTDPKVVTGVGSVRITILPSEALPNAPTLTVTQRAGEPILVPLLRAEEGWVGVYEVVLGRDGTAVITVSGVDRAGNRGSAIISGGTFNVGVKPPPPPLVTSPENNSFTVADVLTVSGTTREDTEISLVVNGVSTYTTKPREDGTFSISSIPLNRSLPNGENTLSLIARDAIGVESESVLLRLLRNIRPSVVLERPLSGAVLSGTSTVLSAKVSDANNDQVLTRFEAKPLFAADIGITGAGAWLRLGESVSGKFTLDTTELPDGEYLWRALASDGATTSLSESRTFTLNNQLPFIRFDSGRRTVVSEQFATVRGSVLAPDIAGDRPTITAIDYSRDGGANYIALPAVDGNYDGFLERFTTTIVFPEQREGVHEILFRATDSRGYRVFIKHPVIIDTAPPKAPTVTYPERGAQLGKGADEDRRKDGLNITLLGKAEPQSTVRVSLGGKTYTTEASFDDGSWRMSVTLLERGAYTIEATAVDLAGNVSPKFTSEMLYNTAPTIVFLTPKDGGGVHGHYSVRYLINDPDGDVIRSYVLSYGRGTFPPVSLASDEGFNTFSWDTTKLPTGNDYYLHIAASDGVATSTEQIPISVDNGAPVLGTFVVPQTVFGSDGTLVASGDATDDLSGVEFIEYAILKEGEEFSVPIPYGMMEKTKERALEKKAEEMAARWQKGTITKGALSTKASWAVNVPLAIGDGNYRFFVRAVDRSGNVSSMRETAIVVDSTPPRVGSVSLEYRNGTIFPLQDGYVIPRGTDVVLALSLEGDTKEAELHFVGGTTTPLRYDGATGLWKAALSFAEPIDETLSVMTADMTGNRASAHVTRLSVLPYGTILRRDATGLSPAKNAKLNILIEEAGTGRYVGLTRGAPLFGEPAYLADGGYILALPRGTYRFRITGDGAGELTTEPLILAESQFITTDFTLEAVNDRGFWSILKAWILSIFN